MPLKTGEEAPDFELEATWVTKFVYQAFVE
ncbi:MAG: hypothetical protein Ct9H300mP25_05010 [Acidobacteriota bacterium]|nr:MAG: hypothetical protein Ct9H300mP25_05010 [Acidobacteriota bacterium]